MEAKFQTWLYGMLSELFINNNKYLCNVCVCVCLQEDSDDDRKHTKLLDAISSLGGKRKSVWVFLASLC